MNLNVEAELKRMHEWIANRGETSIDVRYVEALTRLKRIAELTAQLDSDHGRVGFDIQPARWHENAEKCFVEILRLCGVNHDEA